MVPRRLLVPALGLVLWTTALTSTPAVPRQATTSASRQAVGPLPARLTDQEFWKLSRDMSEPDGFFRSENLVSNEHTFQDVVPALIKAVRPGGVYLGVAPDQNFTYILATQPRMAFIVDIRRGNLLEHLMYKAIIELSADRADFLSLLFSRTRRPGLGPKSTAAELFAAFGREPRNEALYAQNVRAVEERLVKRHGFTLSADDLEQLESIYFSFYWYGPGLRYTAASASGFLSGRSLVFSGRQGATASANFPSYEELIVQGDLEGENRTYLASEDHFARLKNYEERNLIVPVVGNFAGPKALRTVAKYVREHDAMVSAFYVSNVEQYLFMDGLFEDFANNVATLPVDASSVFIRSVSSRTGYTGPHLGPDGRASALDPMRTFVRDFLAGRIRSYYDVNNRSR